MKIIKQNNFLQVPQNMGMPAACWQSQKTELLKTESLRKRNKKNIKFKGYIKNENKYNIVIVYICNYTRLFC